MSIKGNLTKPPDYQDSKLFMGRKMHLPGRRERAEGFGVCRDGAEGAWEIRGDVRVQPPTSLCPGFCCTACMYLVKMEPQRASTAMANAACPQKLPSSLGSAVGFLELLITVCSPRNGAQSCTEGLGDPRACSEIH